jgi:hypothetical protein
LTQDVTTGLYVGKKIIVMAVVKMNDLTEGLSGKVGKIIFRTYRGKTYASSRPRKRKPQSEQQRSNREKFKLATQYAKRMMNDDDMKAYYKRIAKQLALPNAYTAAITDYMRKPQISDVDPKKYTGKPGGHIAISAKKKNFKLDSVNVIVSSHDNQIVEVGKAEYEGTGKWIFRSTLSSPSPYTSFSVMVTATDRMGTSVHRMVSF